jgi:hypothetical protein
MLYECNPFNNIIIIFYNLFTSITNGKTTSIWWTVVGTIYGTNVDPHANGSGLVIPGASGGVQAYHAADNDNLIYLATTSLLKISF